MGAVLRSAVLYYRIPHCSLLEYEGGWLESEPYHAKVSKEYENMEVMTCRLLDHTRGEVRRWWGRE